MEASNAFIAADMANTNPNRVGYTKEQIEVVWQMSRPSMTENNCEMVLPKFVAMKLTEENINDLKARFRHVVHSNFKLCDY